MPRDIDELIKEYGKRIHKPRVASWTPEEQKGFDSFFIGERVAEGAWNRPWDRSTDNQNLNAR